ncbi:MAG TPA: XRE family transcriptional regulator [Micromonosporaceae bacterium]|nr:XRE family transcriptional regulator [Micromonosporaceae bacterium]
MALVDGETIGRRVADARARAHLTQADLARAVGLERSALAKIEVGARRVSALELARIAEQTGEAFEWFVTDPPLPIISYRSGTGSATTSSIDRFVEQVARNVELLQSLRQLGVVELEPLRAPENLAQAVRLAATARDMLGLDPVGPIADLVNPIAAFGLFAFSEDLGADAPDAATTLLERGGVSVINSSRAVGRRRLALAHELGHYLLADEYTVDWRVGAWTDAQRTEWLIDAFARALLLPAEPLSQEWVELNARESVRVAAVRIASEYRVDMSTLAARLADLNLADSDDLSTVRATTTTRADIIEHDLVVTHDLAGTTLPRRYEKAVLAAYRSEQISADRAIDLLHGTVNEAGLPALPPVNESEIWKFVS